MVNAYSIAASKGFPYLGSDGGFRVVGGVEVFFNSFYRYPANIKCKDRLLVGFRGGKSIVILESLNESK